MKKYVFVLSLLVTSMISLSLMAQSTNPVLNDSTNKNIIFTLPNGPSFEMVFVQGGTFTMGCTEDQKGKCENDALPAHQVVLTNFYAGKYEVTQALWKAVMGTTVEQQCKMAGQHNVYGVGDDYPMYYIHFREATTFCENLNQILANQLPEGYEFALPSEAQWEYAARGGVKDEPSMYAGGKFASDVAWYEGISEHSSHPVGQKQPNELGLYDINGNVWEWCQDWYDEDFYKHSVLQDPVNANCAANRVYRGGSWDYEAKLCRVSMRFYGAPSGRTINLGIRLVLTKVGAATLQIN